MPPKGYKKNQTTTTKKTVDKPTEEKVAESFAEVKETIELTPVQQFETPVYQEQLKVQEQVNTVIEKEEQAPLKSYIHPEDSKVTVYEENDKVARAGSKWATPDYPFKDFLEKKIVKVEPVIKRDFISQQVETLPDGFLYEGANIGFELPIDGQRGGFVQILDNLQKYVTPEYPETPLTELEFFSKILGRDLSFTKEDNNFWAGRHKTLDKQGFQPYTVKVPRNGMILDLSDPKHHLDYLVLKANKKYIAPTWEDRKERPTLKFALVDQKKIVDRKKEEIELQLRAVDKFNKIKEDREMLMEFLIVDDPNNVVAKGATIDFLFNQVYDVMSTKPEYFLGVMEDPYWMDKVLVFQAVRASAINKKGVEYYTVGGEPIGKLGDVISMLNKAENHEFKKRIQYQVDLYKKQ